MANPEHVAILSQGVGVWNEWRKAHAEVRPDLSRCDLRGALLEGANLYATNLRDANLNQVNLSLSICNSADFSSADLHWADFSYVSLRYANLSQATLYGANFEGANLSHAYLAGANLDDAYLFYTNLSHATLQAASFNRAHAKGSIFANVNLSGTLGLDKMFHDGPSTIGIDTLYRSGGDIPELFLRGCGVPKSMIENARSLVAAQRPIEYYSVFISYSSKDEALATRLHADLQAAGVRCWYAPENLKTGDQLIERINDAIHLHERLLLILSESSVASTWVAREVKSGLARELREKRQVLFPIRIDDAVRQSTAGWATELWEQLHVGDFRSWKAHDAYQVAFQRLLRDLQMEAV